LCLFKCNQGLTNISRFSSNSFAYVSCFLLVEPQSEKSLPSTYTYCVKIVIVIHDRKGFNMKKLWFLIAIVAIILIGIFWIINGRSASLEDIIKENEQNNFNITSLEIIKNSTDEEVIIEDSKKISQIMGNLFNAQLKKDNFSELEHDESYWITIKTDKDERALGLTLFDQDYISVYSFNEKNKTANYKVTNNLDISRIKSLFE
jgi:hypothetical protein